MRKPCVLLISVDALMPKLVFEGSGLGLELPNIQRLFIEGGTYADQGMKSVFPAFTYTCHQSIPTGTYPENKHNGAWYWGVSNHVENIWQLAHENGYVSASMAFPTSVGAKGDFIAPILV